MIPDPILTLSAICAALSLAGLYLVVRLHQLTRDLADLRAAERFNAIDICRIGDANVEMFGEILVHARALDAHDDRLIRLEETP